MDTNEHEPHSVDGTVCWMGERDPHPFQTEPASGRRRHPEAGAGRCALCARAETNPRHTGEELAQSVRQ